MGIRSSENGGVGQENDICFWISVCTWTEEICWSIRLCWCATMPLNMENGQQINDS